MKINLHKTIKYVLMLFMLHYGTSTIVNAQNGNNDAEEVYLTFTHRGIINKYVTAYYKNNSFYLPVNEIFNLFKLDVTSNGLILSGYYSLDQIPYIINFDTKLIRFGSSTYELAKDDYLINEFDFFLHPDILKQIFNLNFRADFNRLTLSLDTDIELPFIEQILRSRSRKISESYTNPVSYYTLLKGRERKFFDGGFLDYNLSINKTKSNTNFRFNNAIGLHLLGGNLEGSFLGNVSESYDQTTFSTGNLNWEYVLDKNTFLSRITVGQTNMDGVLGNPYTGIRITNEPIEARKIFDEYVIEGITLPQSEVEIYLNKTLIQYQKLDDTGEYKFKTPLFYGNSKIDVLIYGPTGQLTEQNRRIQVPYNFLPRGEINYVLNAGYLDNPIIGNIERNLALQANASIGVNDWLTARLGTEYYSNALENDIPSFTANLSTRAFSHYIISAEAVTTAYNRFTLNAVYPNSAYLTIDYTDYSSNQNIFNSSGLDKQIIASTSVPFRIGQVPINFRLSNFTRYRTTDFFSTQRVNLSTRFKNLGLRFGYQNRTIDTYNFFETSENTVLNSGFLYNFKNIASIPKILRGVYLSGGINYIPNSSKISSTDISISRNIFKRGGQFQFNYNRNFIQNINSFGISLFINFKNFKFNSNTVSSKQSTTATQNLRGSIGFDPNHNNFLFTNRNQVGRSATAVKLFVDNNSNEAFDITDETINEGTYKVSRGGTSINKKNNVLYYTSMQPYYRYNLEMNKGSFRNPTLVTDLNKFSIVTEPNRFKHIEVPFYMSGIMEGSVYKSNSKKSLGNGIGGLKLNLRSVDGEFSKELRTFSDGSFYEYELPPGNYELTVDESQLAILNARSEPEILNFTINKIAEGDFVEGLVINLYPDIEEETDPKRELTLAEVTDEIKNLSEILDYSNEVAATIDDALRLIIESQNAFYDKKLNQAIFLVDKSLNIFKTAQGYALKGSIYYFEKNTEQALKYWRLAININPELIIPDMDTLNERIETDTSD